MMFPGHSLAPTHPLRIYCIIHPLPDNLSFATFFLSQVLSIGWVLEKYGPLPPASPPPPPLKALLTLSPVVLT